MAHERLNGVTWSFFGSILVSIECSYSELGPAKCCRGFIKLFIWNIQVVKGTLFTKSTYIFLTVISAENKWHPDHASNQSTFWQSYHSISMEYCNSLYFPARPMTWEPFFCPSFRHSSPVICRQHIWESSPFHCSCLICHTICIFVTPVRPWKYDRIICVLHKRTSLPQIISVSVPGV